MSYIHLYLMSKVYKSIIIESALLKKLKTARDLYKKDNKTLSNISMASFFNILLDFYDRTKTKR